jgi:hypothetical protein
MNPGIGREQPMKSKIMQLVVALVISLLGPASMAAEPAGTPQSMVRGKFNLPIYPGSTLAEKPGLGVSGATSYLYYSTDSLDVVYAWYKSKLPGGQERMKMPGKMVSYAVPGSEYVNVMVVMSKKGGTDIALSP